MTYANHRNTSVMHAAERIESVRQLSNDERRADWAAKFYARGLHRANGQPRIRVTVPSPLCQREPVAHAVTPAATPVHAAPASVQAAGNFNASLRSDCASQPPPVAAARAGSHEENPFIGDREPEPIARYADIRGI